MSDHQQDRFEMPKAMQSMAEAGFHQARKGFEQFVSGAEQARSSIEERGATVRAGARTSEPRRSPGPNKTCRHRSITRRRWSVPRTPQR